MLKGYDRPSDAASAALLTDELYHALAGGQPCYLFLDDLHLLTDARIACFLAIWRTAFQRMSISSPPDATAFFRKARSCAWEAAFTGSKQSSFG